MPKGVYLRKKPAHNIKTCLHGVTPSRICKKCSREKWVRWEQENPEKVREKKVRWRQENHEKALESSRKSRKAHPETVLRYLQANIDRIRDGLRRWKQANREKVRAHYHARRALKIGNGGRFTDKEWKLVKEFYEYTCLRCDRKEPEIKLTIDHVLPLALGGRNSIDNIQPLCEFCNNSKHNKHIDYREGRIAPCP